MRGKIQLQSIAHTLRALACVAAFAPLPLVGCSKKPVTAVRNLPAYDAEQATLFGDVFRPELFGLTDRSTNSDGLLRDRAARADTVVLAKVVTLNRETRGSERSYSVVLAPLEGAIVGATPSGPLTFAIPENSPVFGWLEGAGNRWVGSRVLLFLRQFEDGTHFFGSADTPEVRATVAASTKPAPIKP